MASSLFRPWRVMSFNLRTAAAEDGPWAWQWRRARVAAVIRDYGPDLLGLQECLAGEQADDVRAALPEHEFVGIPRGGPTGADQEMAPMLLRRTRFRIAETGHFWLGETPDTAGSRSWGADYPRTVSWARLHPIEAPDRSLLFANTHFDYAGDAPVAEAAQLRRWVDGQGTEAVIITGDFNLAPDSPGHRLLTQEGPLADCLRESGETAGSFHDYGREEPPLALDWILASRTLKTLRARVVRDPPGTPHASDHFAVVAELAWADTATESRAGEAGVAPNARTSPV
ncbi:MAG: endonuclease/exonuclease/phosphatase family protein [Zoogloeaceae bacterium]|nr:endonuclease/exonuclease/phosphatase family protein [Zoogloeaceae bacterium]